MPCAMLPKVSAFSLRRLVILVASIVLTSSLIGPRPGESQNRPRPSRAPIPDDTPPLPENTTQCNYQEPIEWLVRENFLPRWTQPAEEQRRRRALQAQVVRFRTENYGYFEGFGDSDWNEHPPTHYASRVEFMGLSVALNERIHPALACVEEQIRSECGDDYDPVRLSGIRTRNTYHNGQVSNHVYGIAIDVDPHLNTCCMCVAQWGDHPLCQREVESIYERMEMPPCWVHVFERFGFYWLGRDRLQDTMHFEFLGDPNHILQSDGPAPHMSEQGGDTESAGDTETESETGETESRETETENEDSSGDSEPSETAESPSGMRTESESAGRNEENEGEVEAEPEVTIVPEVEPRGGCSAAW